MHFIFSDNYSWLRQIHRSAYLLLDIFCKVNNDGSINPLTFFLKPEYFFNPAQALRRFGRIGKPRPQIAMAQLPWGAKIRVHPGENVGCEIYNYGIFDKIVPECIARLLDAGETGMEIGANIGQNCLLMAAVTGSTGRVLAFEPHPEIFAELEFNCANSLEKNWAKIQLEQVALSDISGERILFTPEKFGTNRGSASLREAKNCQTATKVNVRQLDDYVSQFSRVHVCKIDVEGCELKVLQGGQKALSNKVVRDIIFEDFSPQPSSVTLFLQAFGFTVFELHQAWVQPHLRPIPFSGFYGTKSFSYNFLATLEPARAIERFRFTGWHCFRSR